MLVQWNYMKKKKKLKNTLGYCEVKTTTIKYKPIN